LCTYLRRLLALLATALLLNIENLLALILLLLLLALISIVPLGIPIVSWLLVLVLLFQSFAEVIV
jgi:hypothetical protein